MPNPTATAELLKRLDPRLPPPTDDTYIDRRAPGEAQAWAWPGRLGVLLDAGQKPRVLLHGTIGVGKTTEMATWERRLAPNVVAVRVAASAGNVPSPESLASLLRATWLNVVGSAALPSVADPFAIIAAATAGIESATRKRVVVFVDGIDLLGAARSTPFFGPGTWLTNPRMPALVAAAPNTALLRNPIEFRDQGFDTIVHLPPFAVIDALGHADPGVVEWMADGLTRRLGDDGAVESPDLLRRVALSSGGVPRDAIRILRAAVLAAVGAPQIQARHILEGEREVRQDLEQSLQPEDLETLADVQKDARFARDERLVTSNAVLPYEGNARRYFRVHPLLIDVVEHRFDDPIIEGLFR